MIKVDFKKDILPHLIAISIFLALTILIFQPVFFEDNALQQ
jgi:hypothetical protein